MRTLTLPERIIDFLFRLCERFLILNILRKTLLLLYSTILDSDTWNIVGNVLLRLGSGIAQTWELGEAWCSRSDSMRVLSDLNLRIVNDEIVDIVVVDDISHKFALQVKIKAIPYIIVKLLRLALSSINVGIFD